MAYMRRFRKLRSVSFKGNPCCDDPMTNEFLKSALTRVTFLDYKLVTEEEREKGRALFRYFFNRIMNNILSSSSFLVTPFYTLFALMWNCSVQPIGIRANSYNNYNK